MLNKKIAVALASICSFVILSASTLQQVPQQGAPAQTPPAPGQQVPTPAPQKYKNLKVLPKNITNQEMQKVMRNFTASLGVNCGFCHVPMPTPTNPNARDYASDAKPEKQTARDMIKMKNRINKKYFASGGGSAIVAIDCYTCHQGKKEPVNVAPAPPRPEGGPGAPAGPGNATPAAPAKG